MAFACIIESPPPSLSEVLKRLTMEFDDAYA